VIITISVMMYFHVVTQDTSTEQKSAKTPEPDKPASSLEEGSEKKS